LQLLHRSWLTADHHLFARTPVGDFATSVEGFRLRLPVAVMPRETYERWRAKGGNQRRRRARRKRSRRGCRCYFRPLDLRSMPPSGKAKTPLFLRN
jgi:hypothetical protein